MAEQDRVFAKCAWRLIPFMTLLYLVNFIDQVNVGFAALTMNDDLHFSGTVFGFGAGVFFLGYMLMQIPASIVIERLGVRRCIFSILASWGLISAACSLVQGPTSFYALRFCLGLAEAGFFPGMIYYLTLWFPQAYRSRYMAMFVSANALAFVIGAPLSSLILRLDGVSGFHGWQWLFLLEGMPAFLLSFAALALLPDGPARASWLTRAEKETIAARLAQEDAGGRRAAWEALLDPRVIIAGAVVIAISSSIYGIRLWLPQMVQAMGFSNVENGFIVAVIFGFAMLTMILWGRSSDIRRERYFHVALPMFVAAAGFVGAALATNPLFVLAALFVVVASVSAAMGVYWSIPASFLRGPAGATSVAFANCNSSLGGFLGPWIIGVLKDRSGSYASSMTAFAFGLVIGGCIMLAINRALAPRVATAQAKPSAG